MRLKQARMAQRGFQSSGEGQFSAGSWVGEKGEEITFIRAIMRAFSVTFPTPYFWGRGRNGWDDFIDGGVLMKICLMPFWGGSAATENKGATFIR